MAAKKKPKKVKLNAVQEDPIALLQDDTGDGVKREYEVVVVLAGGSSKVKKKSVEDNLTKIVKVGGGEVKKVDDWGDRELSYSIEGNSTGSFLIFALELSGVGAKNLAEKLKHEDDLIRYLLIRKETRS
jgi:small subunit ribosomal protein S6